MYDHLVLGSILVKVTLSLNNAVCPMPIDTISISRSNEYRNWYTVFSLTSSINFNTAVISLSV